MFIPLCSDVMQSLTWLVCSFTSCPLFPPRLHLSLPVFLPFLPPSLCLSLFPYLSQAKVDNEIIDYRDLAAIPRVKAIYDIEHPDMISYKCVNGNSSTLDNNRDNRQGRQSPAEVTSCTAMQVQTQWHVSVSLTCSCWLDSLHFIRPEQKYFWKQIIHLQIHRTLFHCSIETWMNIYFRLAFSHGKQFPIVVYG